MEALFDTMDHLGADVLKLAVLPAGMEDVLRLLLALERTRQRCQRPLIGIAMGKPGIVTRLMGEAFGSCLTFAAADAQSAPGQMRAEDVAGILRIIHHTLEPEGDLSP
jgi:3-dehydroquinate dehydratase-1